MTTYTCKISDGTDSKSITFDFSNSYNSTNNVYVAGTKKTEKTIYKKTGEAFTLKVDTVLSDTTAVSGYKWYKSTDKGYGYIEGATADTLSVAAAGVEDFGYYKCYATFQNKTTGTTSTRNVSFNVYNDDTKASFTQVKEYGAPDYVYDVEYDNSYRLNGSAANRVGDNIRIGVDVTNPDNEAITYSWKFSKLSSIKHEDDSNVYVYEEATALADATPTISKTLTDADFGMYTLTIKNASGSVMDEYQFFVRKYNGKLTAKAKNDYNSYSRTVGENVTFNVEAETDTTDTITYQWYRYESAIYGQTGASLTLSDLKTSDFGWYSCTVKAGSLTSSVSFYVTESACLKVDNGVLDNDTKTVYKKVGEAAEFSVEATAASGTAIEYQWYKDGNRIPGATAATYAIASVTAQDYATYRCTVTAGNETDSVYFSLEANTGLRFVKSSYEENYVKKGEVTSFSAIAVSNAGNVTYQWSKYDKIQQRYVDIAGATEATYTTEPITEYQKYQCKVTDGIAELTFSAGAYIKSDELVTVKASKEYAIEGDEITYTATLAEGDTTVYDYQWYCSDEAGNMVKIAGATGAAITTSASAVSAEDKVGYDSYACKVSAGSEETYVSDTSYNVLTVFKASDITKELPAATLADGENVKIYKKSGAEYMKLTFADMSLLKYYSNVTIINAAGKVQEYVGLELAGRTIKLDGDTAIIWMDVDKYVDEAKDSETKELYDLTKYGYKVTGIKAVMPEDKATLKVSKKTVTVEAGKSVTVGYSAADREGTAVQAKASTGSKKIATVKVASKTSLKITVPKKAAAGSSTKITVKNGSVKKVITVKVANPVKKLKAKKTVTVKKGKTAKITVNVTAANKKKATTDKASAKAASKKIVTVKSAKVSKGKVVVTVKAKKKGKTKLTVTVGKKKAVVTVKVK